MKQLEVGIMFACSHSHTYIHTHIIIHRFTLSYTHTRIHTHSLHIHTHTLHTSSSSSLPVGEVRDVSDWILCSPVELTESKVRSSWEELPFLKMVVEGVACGLYFPFDFFLRAFMSLRNGVGKRTS